MEWVEKNVRSDLRQKGKVYKGRMKGVQGGCETSDVVWGGDCGTDEKTAGGDGGGIGVHVAIIVRSAKNGHHECVHQRDSTGGTVWKENTSGKTEMV